MFRLSFRLLCVGLALALPACATSEHRSIVSQEDDAKDTGVRYYRSAPYLIVYSNGKGGINASIRYLPDVTQKMSVKPQAFLAKLDTTMDFTNGSLVASKDVADSTGFPKAIVEAVKEVAPLLLQALNNADKNEFTVPAPHIYKIVFTGNTVQFVGGKGDVDIKVTVAQPPKEKGGAS